MSGSDSGSGSQATLDEAMNALPFGLIHIGLLCAICAGFVFISIEMMMSSVYGTVFTPDADAGKIEPWQLALLLSSAGMGAATGAPLLGALSDIWGRRGVLILSLLLVGGFSVAGALTANIDNLIVTRVIASLGIGSYIPLSTTYLSETIPLRARGRAVSITLIVGGFGASLASLVTASFNAYMPLGLEGWRWTMIIAAIGCAAMAMLLLYIPESPSWLMARGRFEQAMVVYRRFAGPGAEDLRLDVATSRSAAEKSPPSGSSSKIWTGQLRMRLGIFIILSAVLPWASAAFAILCGAIFTQRGYDSQQALLLYSVVISGTVVGSVLNMFIVDRIPRDRLLIATAVGVILSVLIFGLSPLPAFAMVAGMCVTGFVGIYHMGLILYCAESFPPSLRGKAPAICFGVNRALSIVVPLALLPMLLQAGEAAVLFVIGSAMVLQLLILWLKKVVDRRHLDIDEMRSELAASLPTG